MVRTHVVILSDHALFAEGIASRLRQYLQLVEFEVIDPRPPGAIAQIIAARPSVVILDGTDPGIARRCSLGKLLRLFPKLQVICLDLQQEQAQVVTSEQRSVSKMCDLAEVIGGST